MGVGHDIETHHLDCSLARFQFLPEEWFVSKVLSLFLVAFHVLVLVWSARKWIRVVEARTGRKCFLGRPLAPHYIIYTLFWSNMIGILFARTLHYQFYSWYFHTLPYLLWTTELPWPLVVRFLVCGIVERAFLTFPATSWSAALLQLAHVVIAVSSMNPPEPILLELPHPEKED